VSPRTSTALPTIEPIVPVAGAPPLHDPRWIYEPKFDGFRGMLYGPWRKAARTAEVPAPGGWESGTLPLAEAPSNTERGTVPNRSAYSGRELGLGHRRRDPLFQLFHRKLHCSHILTSRLANLRLLLGSQLDPDLPLAL
jgi:hypothetical protein